MMTDGWTGRKGSGCYANRNVLFTHPAYPGVVVKHCMHPTANFPWYTHSRDGELRTFRLLKMAKDYVAAEYAQEAE